MRPDYAGRFEELVRTSHEASYQQSQFPARQHQPDARRVCKRSPQPARLKLKMPLQTGIANLVRSFFALNRRASVKIRRYIPQEGLDLYARYEDRVAGLMSSRPCQVVLDVGSGKHCPFAGRRDPALHTKILGVDIALEEMAGNSGLDARFVANVASGLPLGDGTVDLITSSAVLEHLQDVELFVKDSARVLRHGGNFIQVFPSKFAPFAVINQLLPRGFSQRLIWFLAPEKKGTCGFPAFYNRCYYSALRNLLDKNQLELIGVEFSYFQSDYFNFFAPAFLLVRLYESLMQRLSARNLCAYVLIVARKR